jgi:cell division inhibitor SepF
MPTFLKKTMVYLGLLDDEYDEYEDYPPRPEPRAPVTPVHEEEPPGRIRTLTREIRPSTPVIRPMSVSEAAKVHVVAPTRFGDAKEIADFLKGNRPVIVNLQVAERDLQRRMIDFCSGVTYALSGEMERVADEVFLLTPSNVKVSEEERQRLQERGFGRT